MRPPIKTRAHRVRELRGNDVSLGMGAAERSSNRDVMGIFITSVTIQREFLVGQEKNSDLTKISE